MTDRRLSGERDNSNGGFGEWSVTQLANGRWYLTRSSPGGQRREFYKRGPHAAAFNSAADAGDAATLMNSSGGQP